MGCAKKIFVAIVLIAAITMITVAIRDTEKRKKSIEIFKFKNIAQVYDFKSNKQFQGYYYTYYYENEKFAKSEDINDFSRENCIGKFYYMNLSTENPNYSQILLDQEVTDTAEILKAGFTKEDLEFSGQPTH